MGQDQSREHPADHDCNGAVLEAARRGGNVFDNILQNGETMGCVTTWLRANASLHDPIRQLIQPTPELDSASSTYQQSDGSSTQRAHSPALLPQTDFVSEASRSKRPQEGPEVSARRPVHTPKSKQIGNIRSDEQPTAMSTQRPNHTPVELATVTRELASLLKESEIDPARFYVRESVFTDRDPSPNRASELHKFLNNHSTDRVRGAVGLLLFRMLMDKVDGNSSQKVTNLILQVPSNSNLNRKDVYKKCLEWGKAGSILQRLIARLGNNHAVLIYLPHKEEKFYYQELYKDKSAFNNYILGLKARHIEKTAQTFGKVMQGIIHFGESLITEWYQKEWAEQNARKQTLAQRFPEPTRALGIKSAHRKPSATERSGNERAAKKARTGNAETGGDSTIFVASESSRDFATPDTRKHVAVRPETGSWGSSTALYVNSKAAKFDLRSGNFYLQPPTPSRMSDPYIYDDAPSEWDSVGPEIDLRDSIGVAHSYTSCFIDVGSVPGLRDLEAEAAKMNYNSATCRPLELNSVILSGRPLSLEEIGKSRLDLTHIIWQKSFTQPFHTCFDPLMPRIQAFFGPRFTYATIAVYLGRGGLKPAAGAIGSLILPFAIYSVDPDTRVFFDSLETGHTIASISWPVVAFLHKGMRIRPGKCPMAVIQVDIWPRDD